jgi:hypothetical protein
VPMPHRLPLSLNVLAWLATAVAAIVAAWLL